MKRLLIGICVLFWLLAMGIGVSMLFQFAHAPTVDYLQEASQAALQGDWDAATQQTRQAQARWEHYRHITAAFADHAPMDEIDSLFAQLQVHLAQKNIHGFPALCARLSRLTEALADSHSFRWWTVL